MDLLIELLLGKADYKNPLAQFATRDGVRLRRDKVLLTYL